MKNHPYYPLLLDLEGRGAVIVGGGEVAARKAASLVTHGANVVVVAPEGSAELQVLVDASKVEWRRKRFEPADVADAAIVFAATDDETVNSAVAAAARARHVPVNVADAPLRGDFIVPAVIESGSIQIAISTGGRSPALARRLRQQIEALLGDSWAELATILGLLREPAIAASTLPSDADRRRFFEAVLDGEILELLRAGRRADAYRSIVHLCEDEGVDAPEAIRQAADLSRQGS